MPDRLRMTLPDLMNEADLARWFGAIVDELQRREPAALVAAVQAPARAALEELVTVADEHLTATDL